MDLTLTPEQERWRAVAREAAAGLGPEATLPRPAAEAGLLGIGLPAELGGNGGDLLGLCLALTELGRASPPAALAVWAHRLLCAGHILLAGSPEQRRRWLPSLARGEAI